MTDAEIEKSGAAADSHDVKVTPFTLFRYVASLALLIFSIIIVGALIFTGNTRVAKEANPWVALIVCVSWAVSATLGFSTILDGAHLGVVPPGRGGRGGCRVES